MEIFPEPALAVVMVVPFLFTLVALHFILFRPLMGFLDAREAEHEQANAEARALEAQVAERLSDLDHRLESARSEIAGFRAEQRADALKEEGTILAAARAAADQKISAALVDINAAADTARDTLKQTATGLSAEIAAQVLGREIRA